MSENDIVSNENFDFEKAFNESFRNIEENTIVTVKVADISSDLVFLDFGYKSEAKLSTSEFEELPEIGDELDVYLIRLEGRNGEPVVSKKRVDQMKERREFRDKCRNNEIVKGKVIEIKSKGAIVEYKSITGFIPFSIFDSEPNVDHKKYLNKEIEFYIDKITLKNDSQLQNLHKKKGDEFIGNRKRVVFAEKNQLKDQFFAEKKVGDLVKGKVKNITDFGAFIDLGGVDALLRLKDISWVRIDKVEDALKIGQELETVILTINEKTRKLSVGLKQLQEDPWTTFFKNYNIDDVVVGTVVSIETYGVFVRVIDGVEGLLHTSDMSWTKKINNPGELVKENQKLELKILNIDEKNRKISLSLKHLLDNPWDDAEEKYKVGIKIKGKIKNITTFGFFINLEEGIDALLHLDDLSWTETVKNPHNIYQVGDEIEAIVIQCDAKKAKIRVGVKQLSDDPWKVLKDNYKTGDIIECEVEKVDFEKGLTVKISDDISTFIPVAHVGIGKKLELIDTLKTSYKQGDKINVMITNFDPRKRNIKVSIKEYVRKQEREKVEDFLHDSKEDSKYTLGDALKHKIENK